MRFWPASLQSRLMALLFLALLLANTLTLSLLFYERMSSARSVMLGNLASDVATSVAILDRLPAAERPRVAAEAGARQLSLSAGLRRARRLPGQLARPGRSPLPAGGAERAVPSKYCDDPRPAAAYFRPILPSTTAPR